MLPLIGELRPWTDPTVLGLRRLPGHAPLGGFRRASLDGLWQLELFANPDTVPATALHTDRSNSVEVEVPGNWTMQDLGMAGTHARPPQYTNIQMPFPGPPPKLPEHNPTGVYRRRFRVPASWRRDRIVVGVDGAESVHAVYVNRTFAGYGTDSRLPSEYDITDAVVDGDNELAIVVIQFSAHSYIEDQDQWWMAGLHRPVWIEARPAVHLRDLPVDTTYDHATRRGSISVRAHVEFGEAPEPGWMVRTSITDPAGNEVGAPLERSVPHEHARPYVFDGFVVAADFSIARARPWSAEQPDRYTVLVELVDARGRVRQTETVRVGLRSVEVRDRRLLVNGQPIWVFGVNRHDHHPDRGKAVTVADIRADLAAMRRLNISAIRTAHYPNRLEFYDLCDELGFYVVDEANIECHGYNRSLCHDPRYRAAWVDRGARMVQRDRNHPSVIVWSLGNESGYGASHDALAGWIRRADPSRPLHYEDAIRVEGWDDGGRAATDIVCPMYPEIDDIRSYGERGAGDRPLIMCEYSHAMGNSNGSLADYWDVITSTDGLQGGFVWEWKDHGLRQSLADGRVRLAHGGQFDNEPHDGNFVADGIMSADLVPHPATRELAWVHRPVTVEAGPEPGVLRVANRRSFTSLRDLRGRVEFLHQGQVVASRRWRVPAVAPHAAVDVALPSAPDETEVARVTWSIADDTWFADAGHVVAWDEVAIAEPSSPIPPSGQAPNGPTPEAVVEPRLSLWRAPVDNDGFKLMPELSRRIGVGGLALMRWQDAGLDHCDPETLVDHTMTQTDTGDGAIVFRHVVEVPDALVDLPRIGVTFTLPTGFDLVRWYGRGPHENYPDRNRSALLGTWQAGIDDPPYLIPQEYGLRTDCRWVEFIDRQTEQVVRIDSRSAPMHFSATHHRAEDLYQAPHQIDLVPRDDLIVHLDAAHRGLGTASCGPDVDERYRLPAGRYEFAYRVTVLDRSQAGNRR